MDFLSIIHSGSTMLQSHQSRLLLPTGLPVVMLPVREIFNAEIRISKSPVLIMQN
jgi:hypothetical protein